MNPKRVYIKNLGCKVNLTDAHRLAYEFQNLGYQVVDAEADPDVVVINSCSVTQKAEQDARYFARRFRRSYPGALIVVTGCYAQIDSHELAQMDEVSYVVPNEQKGRLAAFVHAKVSAPQLASTSESKIISGSRLVRQNRGGHFKSSLAYFGRQVSSQTRAFLKIQDGCNDFCSYCQIPYARGQSKSVEERKILHEIQRLAKADIKEIVLTGIHLGEWGEDLPGSPTITDLLQQIFEITPNHFRLRLSSLEPSEFQLPLADLLAKHKERVCRHFHFPLQSGSDRILKLMRRRYSSQEYLATTQRAREALGDDIHISADVMVGFPGETEEDFKATMDLMKACRLSSWHIFPYSKRPNTQALRLSGHVPSQIIRQRSQILRKLSSACEQEYARQFVGTSLEVLWESSRDASGRLMGKSSEYLRVCAPPESASPGTITRSLVAGFAGMGVLYAQQHQPHPLL